MQGDFFHRPLPVCASDGRRPFKMDPDVTDPLGHERLAYVAEACPLPAAPSAVLSL